ncbi:MAG: histidine--tRNA ligase [Bacteroidetes bacterium]|nr:histidine--tRNA ligase [Bacteroidota bacterium]
MQKPSIPKGTRDFSPAEMVKRNHILDTIIGIFQRFGYLPLETPAMENLSTLLGKYGEEGDRLLFRILNSGDFLSGIERHDWTSGDLTRLSSLICDKGLRYDLTVPFARYVVQHLNEITFPFKRYQVQPVWRADRPQKGRYREFFQCDVDVIGSHALLNEVELLNISEKVFSALGIDVIIKINNRKILSGIAAVIGEADKLTDMTVAIDKLDKIGLDNVNSELRSKGISDEAIQKLQPVILLKGTLNEKFSVLEQQLKASSVGLKGIEEMKTIFNYLDKLTLTHAVEFDLTLARGLNYYTGAIIEVKARDVSIGSLCGGGRYDDLTGIFGLPGVSGVGISFGADRIYDVMEEMHLFPEKTKATTQVMFANFGLQEEIYCLPLMDNIRKAGINAELFPESGKLKKQMTYADKKNIPFVILIGENEISSGLAVIKDMKSGEQRSIAVKDLIGELNKILFSVSQNSTDRNFK